jgi:hypothetical protein
MSEVCYLIEGSPSSHSRQEFCPSLVKSIFRQLVKLIYSGGASYLPKEFPPHHVISCHFERRRVITLYRCLYRCNRNCRLLKRYGRS